ncbi:hypothetical protein Lac2_17840 [Claveliimonas bilis]|nr:hypothetical protein Lac2_17840 [Claveliimonas bilis]
MSEIQSMLRTRKNRPEQPAVYLKGLRKEIASLAINLQRHMLVDSKALLLRIVKE